MNLNFGLPLSTLLHQSYRSHKAEGLPTRSSPRQPFALIELAQTAFQIAIGRFIYFLRQPAEFVLQKILCLLVSARLGLCLHVLYLKNLFK